MSDQWLVNSGQRPGARPSRSHADETSAILATRHSSLDFDLRAFVVKYKTGHYNP